MRVEKDRDRLATVADDRPTRLSKSTGDGNILYKSPMVEVLCRFGYDPEWKNRTFFLRIFPRWWPHAFWKGAR